MAGEPDEPGSVFALYVTPFPSVGRTTVPNASLSGAAIGGGVNAAPQYKDLNQKEWNDLEEYILDG